MMRSMTTMNPTRPKLVVELVNEQAQWPIDSHRLFEGARVVLDGEGIAQAEISIAVVDDEAIHQINRQFLNHDEPTDVISFVLDRQEQFLHGEIIASADTAARRASEFGWSLGDELLLYVIHGTLHLAGFDDLEPDARAIMRQRERFYLARFDLKPRYDDMPSSEEAL